VPIWVETGSYTSRGIRWGERRALQNTTPRQPRLLVSRRSLAALHDEDERWRVGSSGLTRLTLRRGSSGELVWGGGTHRGKEEVGVGRRWWGDQAHWCFHADTSTYILTDISTYRWSYYSLVLGNLIIRWVISRVHVHQVYTIETCALLFFLGTKERAEREKDSHKLNLDCSTTPTSNRRHDCKRGGSVHNDYTIIFCYNHTQVFNR
jgi:hypothetical protein